MHRNWRHQPSELTLFPESMKKILNLFTPQEGDENL